MEHTDFLEQIRVHSEAMRAAALKAGPEAQVPTCPDWTVQKLTAHQARAQAWAADNLTAGLVDVRPEFPPAPQDWAELHAWWVAEQERLIGLLTEKGRTAPAWTFGMPLPEPGAMWARRMAHEVAIHRLDAEHALHEVAGGVDPARELRFEPAFAADGIEEALVMAQLFRKHEERTEQGTILFHAADAGLAVVLTLTPGQVAKVGPVQGSGIDTDTVVAGTADAIYRRLWNRPNTAVVTGNSELLDQLGTP
ncbi:MULTISPECIES: maleylpyruvate isomerase N-terminal domain-containing protein [unclassified Crossiella]|uniref:maleylpyruvate isomerase N-terminal domain-containing protein n=1 Tax=unclassified Crossiella TaxID=2620835 RepID=UPI001FFF54EA|nr:MULTISPECIES: maleylpyruvate isomerase N-terminal domain-containing protein [unclassified Crossiella]MCK2236682.1 maleylpyruvate isomerase N-terminal domain-containing protein [Crossiella sp. S99.2]MCK2250350.1 maleylpyruvate isomerase N-terminal domain-containing protein [Crossiella sp. S99.1]